MMLPVNAVAAEKANLRTRMSFKNGDLYYRCLYQPDPAPGRPVRYTRCPELVGSETGECYPEVHRKPYLG